MARFYQIPIGGIFFEGETGEYYVKKSEKTAHVYVLTNSREYGREYLDKNNEPIICEFSPGHQVEDF